MPSPILLAAAICIASVHDGDTLRLCSHERIRLQRIDAPEVRGSPRCSPASKRRLAASPNRPWCDYRLGDTSQAALAKFLETGPILRSDPV
jgi:endonuclease YncB( thermonuclease family)